MTTKSSEQVLFVLVGHPPPSIVSTCSLHGLHMFSDCRGRGKGAADRCMHTSSACKTFYLTVDRFCFMLRNLVQFRNPCRNFQYACRFTCITTSSLEH